MSLKHLIIVSLCLLTIAINTRAAPGNPVEMEPKEDEEIKSTIPEPETKPDPDPEPEKVQLIQTSDSFVIIRLLIDPKQGEKKFKKFALVYALERPNKQGVIEWAYSDKDASVNFAKIQNKVIGRGVVGKVFQYDVEVTNIQPDTKIKILFDLFYDEEKVRTKEIELRTKAKPPVTSISAQLLTLQFENPKAVKYFAKVNKMKDDKETDCVLELTMSPCFGNSIGLPGLISGEKYSIKVWYIQADNSESEVTTQVITGL